MLFNILIPVYNCELYLEECLNSILSQAGNDYKVIIIDDGSTDKSGEICDFYAKRYKNKVAVIHQENKGVNLTRKELLRHANGEYILFVDSDDYIHSEALEILREKIKLASIDIIIFEYARFYDNEIQHSNLSKVLKYDTTYSDNKNDVFDILLQSNELNSMCTKLFSKQLLDKCYANLPDVRVEIGEDFLQIIPLLTTASTIKYINDELYFCRIHGNNSCLNFNSSRFNDTKIIGQLLDDHLMIWEAKKEQVCLANQKIMKMIVGSIMQIATLESEMSLNSQYKYLKSISKDSYFAKTYILNKYGLFRKAEKIPITLLNYKMPLITLIYLHTYKRYATIVHKFSEEGNLLSKLRGGNV